MAKWANMETSERIALVNKMARLVDELYFLEACCPQQTCPRRTSQNSNAPSTNWVACGPRIRNVIQPQPQYICMYEVTQPKTSLSSAYSPKPSASSAYTVSQPNTFFSKPNTSISSTYKADYINHFPPKKSQLASARTSQDPDTCMMKCEPHKCQADPKDAPLITWTPVLEIRKTTKAKDLERQNDDPITQYVYVEPPGCPYQPVWSTKDPMCEKHCGPPPGREYINGCPALGPPPGYNGGPIELCCPGGKGPPVDRWGQSYECKQTLDGRAICKPTKEAGPTDWCDTKTTPFRQCETLEESKKILTRGKVLNGRFKAHDCLNQDHSKRSSSLYKRPIWPKKESCYDGRCRSPGAPGNKGPCKSSVNSRDLAWVCTKI